MENHQAMVLAREVKELKIVIAERTAKLREKHKEIVKLLQKLERSHKAFIGLVRWIDHISDWPPEKLSEAIKEYAEGLRRKVPQAFHEKNGGGK